MRAWPNTKTHARRHAHGTVNGHTYPDPLGDRQCLLIFSFVPVSVDLALWFLRAVLRHTAAVQMRFTCLCAAQNGECGLENLRLVPLKQKYWSI